MLPFRYSVAALALFVGTVSATPAVLARGNDLIIKTGKGEEINIQNGFFGTKKKVVKDRFGDKYESKKGWFGSKEQQASVLGNSFSRKKGILGGTEIQGSTILGDSIKTKKGIFGRRTTEIDASGVTNLVQGFMGKAKNGQSPLAGLGAGLGFGKQGAGGGMGFGGNMTPGVPANADPKNFDLDNFDLNKGLPKDFGNPTGGGAPNQGFQPQGLQAQPQSFGAPNPNYGWQAAPGGPMPDGNSLPEVPPRMPGDQQP